MENKKKSLKSFALNKQVISKLQQETIVGGGTKEDNEKLMTLLMPFCHTSPTLCPPITRDRFCQGITVITCNPTGNTMQCTVA